MGSYIPSTGEERQAMLQAIGLTSTDQLFDVVPEAVRVKNLDLPEGLSEREDRKSTRLNSSHLRIAFDGLWL